MPSHHTYHCLCTHLLLATPTPLPSLPTRTLDASTICQTTTTHLAPNSTISSASPTILKLDDGFEKRYAIRCTRCGLEVGYRLDGSQFDGKDEGVREDVVFLLAGGMMSTEEMMEGKDMSREIASAG